MTRWLSYASGLSVVLSILLVLMWIRSAWYTDRVVINLGQRAYAVESDCGGIDLLRYGHRLSNSADGAEVERSLWLESMSQYDGPVFPWPASGESFWEQCGFVVNFQFKASGSPFNQILGYWSVPIWFVLLCTSILPGVWIYRLRHKARNADFMRCAICGYDLRASTDRCPECGADPLHGLVRTNIR